MSQRCISAALKVDESVPKAMKLPKTVGRYMLAKKSCRAHTKHGVFECEQERNFVCPDGSRTGSKDEFCAPRFALVRRVHNGGKKQAR